MQHIKNFEEMNAESDSEIRYIWSAKTHILVATEKKNKVWRVVSAPIPAGIGRKGFAVTNAKREGD